MINAINKPTNINIVHVGANNWFDYKHELIFGLADACRRIGYSVTVSSNHFIGGITNLIIGADVLINQSEFLHQIISQAHDNKIKLVLFDGEVLQDQKLNGREQWNIGGLIELAKASVTVGCPYLTTQSFYLRNNIYATFLPWKINTGIRKLSYETERTPVIPGSLVFTGLIKGTRGKRLQDIANVRGISLTVVDQNEPFTMRFDAEKSCAGILGLDWASGKSPLNPSRAFSALLNGKHFFHDHSNDAEGYGKFGHNLNTLDLETDLSEILNSTCTFPEPEFIQNEIINFDQMIKSWLEPHI